MLIVIEVVRIQRNCGAALVDWGGGGERGGGGGGVILYRENSC